MVVPARLVLFKTDISSYLGRIRRTWSSWIRTMSKECLLTLKASPINSFKWFIYLWLFREKLYRIDRLLGSYGTQKNCFWISRISGIGNEMFI